MEKIGNIEIEVINGNLAEQAVDCLVVPEFNYCASGGGVGRAIYRAGMSDGMNEYDNKAHTSPLECGDVMFTKSGRLDTLLAHVATVDAQRDEQFMVIFKAVVNTLVKANELGVRTIAVPELGTGIIGCLTQEQAARAIFGAIYKFTELKPENILKSISLVIFGNSTQPAEKVLSDESYKKLRQESGQKKFNMAKWLIGMKLV
ncbi:MAG: macro domain-containing protein [Alphaproteobacteria bacterium]|nr:macro domain-containing protein [Alphaproteobacteria bacterium]